MLKRLRTLSWGRKLILVLLVLAAPLLALMQVAVVSGYVFESGQKFGIVVTSWTVLALTAVLAWQAAR
jgi:hypothetical protein